ncbi:unnamed protein product [Lactuca saligna]|uniref:Uncharacterized protein n=1 Tax=Lactuca saligna TaxID=75948 RepID=A0AA35VFI9_LACSI|nr:unnamed protein product [Lactuca saligna]
MRWSSLFSGVSDYQPFPISYVHITTSCSGIPIASPACYTPSPPPTCSATVAACGLLHRLHPPSASGLLHREMDSKEQSEKLKNYEAQYANYLKAKYFSDKDIYGGNIFEEKTTIGGMTIRASSEAGTRSYEDPVGYWNEKYAPRIEPSTETTTATNLSNGNHSSKKSA